MMAEARVVLAAAAYLGLAIKAIWPGAADSMAATPVISTSASGGSSLAPRWPAISLSFISLNFLGFVFFLDHSVLRYLVERYLVEPVIVTGMRGSVRDKNPTAR